MTVLEQSQIIIERARALRSAIEDLESGVLQLANQHPGSATFANTALANVQRMVNAATGCVHLASTGGSVIAEMVRFIENPPARIQPHSHSH